MAINKCKIKNRDSWDFRVLLQVQLLLLSSGKKTACMPLRGQGFQKGWLRVLKLEYHHCSKKGNYVETILELLQRKHIFSSCVESHRFNYNLLTTTCDKNSINIVLKIIFILMSGSNIKAAWTKSSYFPHK